MQAFGSIGSLEAAYYRKTGTQKLLSEQMLMDCAWDAKDENKGCMGGFQPLAFQWLFPDGKIASEAEYPYKGVTDFCRSNETSGVRFQNVRTAFSILTAYFNLAYLLTSLVPVHNAAWRAFCFCSNFLHLQVTDLALLGNLTGMRGQI